MVEDHPAGGRGPDLPRADGIARVDNHDAQAAIAKTVGVSGSTVRRILRGSRPLRSVVVPVAVPVRSLRALLAETVDLGLGERGDSSHARQKCSSCSANASATRTWSRLRQAARQRTDAAPRDQVHRQLGRTAQLQPVLPIDGVRRPRLFQEWVLEWRGLAARIETVPVVPSKDMREGVAPHLGRR
jgi:hypothetical protein